MAGTPAGLEGISDSLILGEAVKQHQADPDSKDDKIPQHVLDATPGLDVDPKKVAAGDDPDDPDDDDDDKKGGEGADDKKGGDGNDDDGTGGDDFEPYIPEAPKDDPDPKPDPAKKTNDEPAKPPTPGKPADDDDVKAFLDSLKEEGFEEDSLKAFARAIELGGQRALKQFEAQQTERDAQTKQREEENDRAFQDRRRQEFTVIGKYQKDGRLPRVPVEIQKKFAEGKQLNDTESKHPGIQRQVEVWKFMTDHNKVAMDEGNQNYITNFAQALDLLEAKEIRDGKVKQDKQVSDVRKTKASKLKGGAGGGSGEQKSSGYVRGQTLDDVAQSIMDEFATT